METGTRIPMTGTGLPSVSYVVQGPFCHACGGTGILATPDGKTWQKCPRCGGSGYNPGTIIC